MCTRPTLPAHHTHLPLCVWAAGSLFLNLRPLRCPQEADRECAPCSSCEEGATFTATPCLLSADTVCLPCSSCTANEYLFSPCTVDRDTRCVPFRNCTVDEYEVQAPTPTSQRVCEALTVCSNFEYESTAPTATTDRRCSPLRICLFPRQYGENPSWRTSNGSASSVEADEMRSQNAIFLPELLDSSPTMATSPWTPSLTHTAVPSILPLHTLPELQNRDHPLPRRTAPVPTCAPRVTFPSSTSPRARHHHRIASAPPLESATPRHNTRRPT